MLKINYLCTILSADDKMKIEIAEIIVKGNKEYCANAKLIKSKFLKVKHQNRNIQGVPFAT
jgi:hypothetical protein